MYIPAEPARAKRQIVRPVEPTTTAADPQNPFESIISKILNPGGDDETSTSTRTTATATRTTRTTSESTSSSTRTTRSLDSTSTSLSSTRTRTTSSTSSDATDSSTSSVPTFTPPIPATSTNKSTVVITQTSTSLSPSGTSDASNNGDQPSTGMTPLVMGIVIAASVIFGLIFLALVTRKVFQYRRRQKRVSWADNISPFAPTVNETGYEKPLPQAPAPAPASSYPPPSRMYGSQDGGYGATGTGAAAGVGYGVGASLGAGYGTNLDKSNSYNSTGTGYAAYQNYPAQTQMMQQYSPAAPSSAGYTAPYPYNTAGVGAGAAALGGAAGMAYNNNSNNAAPPPPANNAMPNPFAVSAVDAAGPVPITAPGASSAGQQILVVKRTFAPTLPDELSIATGESVRVLAVYDDGWCKVRKLGAGGEEGVVPYECLDNPGTQGGSDPAQNSQLKRASSLYNAPRA